MREVEKKTLIPSRGERKEGNGTHNKNAEFSVDGEKKRVKVKQTESTLSKERKTGRRKRK